MEKITRFKTMFFAVVLFLGSAGLFAQTVFYKEDFNTMTGTAGWSGKAASEKISEDDFAKLAKGSEGSVWQFESAYKGAGCVKLGTGKKKGTATTPKLGIYGDAILTFRAGAWDGKSEKTKLKLELIGGGTLALLEVELSKGKFESYSLKITGGTGNTQVKFSGEDTANSRFFLDEVVVKKDEPATVVEPPTFDPPAGQFSSTPVSIEIKTATEGAKIYYTIDGSVPTAASTEYTATISLDISNSPSLKAIAVKEGLTDSEVAEATYIFAPITVAEPPTFTPGEGEFFTSPVSVEIKTVTEGAKIYYTIDGTNPTTASAEYTDAISLDISANTSLKAIAVKEGLTNSEVAEATYSLAATVATLAEVRALGLGKKVIYTQAPASAATVTFLSKHRNAKFIQDATGAILIDDEEGKMAGDYVIGTKISRIKGVLQDYHGMLQLVPAEDALQAVEIEAFQAQEVNLSDLTVDDQAKLVKVKNIKLAPSKGEKFQRGKVVSIVESTSVVIQPLYSDLDYLKQPVPTIIDEMVAVVYVHKGKMQLVPRSKAEIISSDQPTALTKPASFVKLYSTEGQIHFEAKAGELVEVYSMVGQVLYKAVVAEGLNTVELPKGVVLVKLGGTVEKVFIK